MTGDVRSARKVAVVTGAGRGIGREHALVLAERGYAVVVNDLGVGLHGEAPTESPAEGVVAAIVRGGGEAVVSNHDVSDWAAAGELVRATVETFGRLDVLINNAGIIRDAVLYKMTEQQWDDVIRVHLRGTAATAHHAAVHWRSHAKGIGDPIGGRLINTTSATGMFGNVGQTNYTAAKAGIIGLSLAASLELARYGVTVNVVAPVAASRMLKSVRGDRHDIDLDPGYVARVAAWLCGSSAASVTGKVFAVGGAGIYVGDGWSVGPVGHLDKGAGAADDDAVLLALAREARPNVSIAAGSPLEREGRGAHT